MMPHDDLVVRYKNKSCFDNPPRDDATIVTALPTKTESLASYTLVRRALTSLRTRTMRPDTFIPSLDCDALHMRIALPRIIVLQVLSTRSSSESRRFIAVLP